MVLQSKEGDDPVSKLSWVQELARPDFDWQLLQSFRQVVESGSFRLAARNGNCALNTLRGRVANLAGTIAGWRDDDAKWRRCPRDRSLDVGTSDRDHDIAS